jgi:hypothetical protein
MAKSCSIEKDSFSFISLRQHLPQENKRDYIHSFHLISRTLVTFQLVNNCVFGRAFFPTGILFICFLFFFKNLIRQSDGSNIDRGREKKTFRSFGKQMSFNSAAGSNFIFIFLSPQSETALVFFFFSHFFTT